MSTSSTAKAPKKSRRERRPKDPNKPGRFSQISTLYKGAVKQNPRIPLWMALAFLVGFLPLLLIGLAWGHPFYLGFIGLMVGLLLMMIVFGRLAERAAYSQLDGQPGASGAALGALRRGWFVEQEPVAADAGRARNPRDMGSAAMVFRAVGRPGVVLIGEGPKANASKLLNSEKKRVERVVGPEVPVTIYRVGQGDDTVAVSEITKRMGKLDKKLTTAEVTAVNKRLRALGTKRPPIPPGMDPRNARPDRRGMRGR
ncbi:MULTISPECIES: DUF4191 domain-containing protein [unclassified Yimella]|uniref:DUF4191 domain-containing protein n=1 Tax=unclassified Yimella TaxID=2649892 RepID=UPI00101D7B60|nr:MULTISPECIES: DUF4191 domain-containing protein [unclassified Yimella]MCG8655606.1 DUF4191 domain-containing protein [Yimella sp. NH-Cas1]RYG78969.1 DUF4191 domain-containing protein [Yimella sp. RIT 621]